MAVPDTNTFSLQDVVDEINPTTDDLVDCISDAIEGNYDTNYFSSPATSLLEFRNYSGSVSLTAITVGNVSIGGGPSCTIGGSVSAYHNGSNTYPEVGDTVYQDSSGSTLFTIESSYRRVNGATYSIRTNSSAVVIEEFSCIQ